MRAVGSGFANDAARAIENLLAACLVGKASLAGIWEGMLQDECNRNRCGIPASVVRRRIERLVDKLQLDVVEAEALETGHAGDVRARTSTGRELWFEVKAQTKKAVFDEIVQADWVRDETETLRWLTHNEPAFSNELPSWALGRLKIPNPGARFQGWSFGSLWLCDVALLTTPLARRSAGVPDPTALRDFTGRKWFVHLTQAGLRAVRLSEIVAVHDTLLDNKAVGYAVRTRGKTAASVQVSLRGSLGEALFTYHVAYPSGVLGRHKAHARFFLNAPFTQV